jgi:CheY-like chemotaxis protein
MHPRTPAGTADPPGGNATRRPRILLAEDCVASRLLTTALLRGLGCDIEAVADGGDAVTRASSARYDLILLDIDMPVMDGIRAARLIRSRLEPANTPIIALSGYGATDCLRDTARTAFDAVIQKPTGRRQLAELLTLAGRPLP